MRTGALSSVIQYRVRRNLVRRADQRLDDRRRGKLHVGRLVWVKGLPYFIKAIKKIEDSGWPMTDKIRYLIVGEGELRIKLEDLVKALKIKERVIFTGFRVDVKEILSALNIFVLSSIREGQPIILLEAMAMGIPIVATNIEGVNEIIEDGVTGILVHTKHPGALAEAIMYVLQDDKKAYAMGRAARQVVESKFSVGRMLRQTESVYKSLLKDKLYKI